METTLHRVPLTALGRIGTALDLAAQAVLATPGGTLERAFYVEAYRALYRARQVAEAISRGATHEEVSYEA